MTRVHIKIGDIFYAKVSENSRKFFQYIAIDEIMLHSAVIRAFAKEYPNDYEPTMAEIVADEVSFYAHCLVKVGAKFDFWHKAGKHSDIGNLDIVFRRSKDYGSKPGEQVDISCRWDIWKLSDLKFTYIGKLTDEYKSAEIGIVMSPKDIVDRMRTGKYYFRYPGFE